MNKLPFISFAIGLMAALAACNPDPIGGDLEDSFWTLASAKLENKAFQVPKTNETTLVFSAGKLNGKAACNSYFGNYATQGATLKIQGLGATKRFCDAMDLENAYITLLTKAISYSVRGDKLEISSSDGTLVFNRMKKGDVETEKYAQGIGKLAAQFPIIDGEEMLHLHPILRVDNPGDYPFQGTLIDTSYYRYFNSEIQEIWAGGGGDVMAVGQYADFYICRIPGRYVSSDIAIFKVKNGEMQHLETIAWAWCDEGWCNQQDAWLTDIDRDGRTDVIQHYTLTDDSGKLKEERMKLIRQGENGDMVTDKGAKLDFRKYKMAKI